MDFLEDLLGSYPVAGMSLLARAAAVVYWPLDSYRAGFVNIPTGKRDKKSGKQR